MVVNASQRKETIMGEGKERNTVTETSLSGTTVTSTVDDSDPVRDDDNGAITRGTDSNDKISVSCPNDNDEDDGPSLLPAPSNKLTLTTTTTTPSVGVAAPILLVAAPNEMGSSSSADSDPDDDLTQLARQLTEVFDLTPSPSPPPSPPPPPPPSPPPSPPCIMDNHKDKPIFPTTIVDPAASSSTKGSSPMQSSVVTRPVVLAGNEPTYLNADAFEPDISATQARPTTTEQSPIKPTTGQPEKKSVGWANPTVVVEEEMSFYYSIHHYNSADSSDCSKDEESEQADGFLLSTEATEFVVTTLLDNTCGGLTMDCVGMANSLVDKMETSSCSSLEETQNATRADQLTTAATATTQEEAPSDEDEEMHFPSDAEPTSPPTNPSFCQTAAEVKSIDLSLVNVMEESPGTAQITMMNPAELLARPNDDEESAYLSKRGGEDPAGFKHPNENHNNRRCLLWWGGVQSSNNESNDSMTNTNVDVPSHSIAVAQPIEESKPPKHWFYFAMTSFFASVAIAIVLIVIVTRPEAETRNTGPSANTGDHTTGNAGKAATFIPYLDSLVAPDVGLNYGRSLALSKNANVLAIGAPWDTNDKGHARAGAVHVFIGQGSGTWTPFGQVLYGSDRNDFFGDSVVLSKDGFTIAVGSPFTDIPKATQAMNPLNDKNITDPTEMIQNAGHVSVFKYRPGFGKWHQVGQILYGDESQDYFGDAVAMSADGQVLAVGAPEEAPGKEGSVRVFYYDKYKDDWEQMGSDIVGIEASDRFGYALDLSENGHVLAVGGHGNRDGTGYVRVFEFSFDSLNWEQFGQTIFGEELDSFGVSVALSASGKTVAAGAPARSADDTSAKFGEVRVLEYSSNNKTWVSKGQNLVGDHINDFFGWSIDMSDDGNVLAVGANRHNINGPVSGMARVYEYTKRNSNWTQLGQDFTGAGTNFGLGYEVGLSPDGNFVAIQDDGGLLCSNNNNGDGNSNGDEDERSTDDDDCERTGRVRVFEKVMV